MELQYKLDAIILLQAALEKGVAGFPQSLLICSPWDNSEVSQFFFVSEITLNLFRLAISSPGKLLARRSLAFASSIPTVTLPEPLVGSPDIISMLFLCVSRC